MSFIAWIVLGLIAGFIGSKVVNKSGEGLLLDIWRPGRCRRGGGWVFIPNVWHGGCQRRESLQHLGGGRRRHRRAGHLSRNSTAGLSTSIGSAAPHGMVVLSLERP